MRIMKEFNKLATENSLNNAVKSLKENGFDVYVVESRDEAKKKALELIPENADVMTMTSVTLEELGISKEINDSGNFNSVRTKLTKMDRETQGKQMNQIGAAPEVAIGSVHAVTEDGKVLIASNTGSQLPAYVYGAEKVIWVVGTQKIVKNLEEGMQRIEEYTLPLESERARKAYGSEGSEIKKLLIFNKERPNRISIVLLNDVIGF